MRTNAVICILLCSLLLTACGQKGDLYLKETKETKETGEQSSEAQPVINPIQQETEQADK